MPDSLLIDLTNQKSDFLNQRPGISFVPAQGVIAQPHSITGWLLYKVVERFFDRGEVKDLDAENISEIIQTGAESDVDEMTIRVEKDQVLGADLKGTLQSKGKSGSRRFTANIGDSGETVYEIDVKYNH